MPFGKRLQEKVYKTLAPTVRAVDLMFQGKKVYKTLAPTVRAVDVCFFSFTKFRKPFTKFRKPEDQGLQNSCSLG